MPKKNTQSVGVKKAGETLTKAGENQTLEIKKMNELVAKLRNTRVEAEQALVQAILEDRYEIVEYETGVAALAGLKEYVPDLILLDISLPEMDGTEVLSRLREDPRMAAVPVV